jgi:tripartite-type tricarboxylate transporter receptor subunit TctC
MLRMKTLAAFLIAALFCAGAALGQTYPARAIRVIAPTIGGGVDVNARIVAPYLSAALGQQIVIDNRGGAGGILAAEAVIRAQPDGYTLLVYGPPVWLNPLIKRGVTYDPLKDLQPVGLLTLIANLLVVHPSVPVKTVRELIALAKSKPGQLFDAGSDTGSSAHLGAELFKSMAGVSIVRVPYKGVGAGITALVSGEVHLMMPAISAAMPHVRSGRLRALAVSTVKPTPLAPGMPTIAESGVPGFSTESANAYFAPAGTPPAIVAKFNEELNRVLRNPEVREKLLASGSEPTGGTPQLASETVRQEMLKWGKLIRDLGLQED